MGLVSKLRRARSLRAAEWRLLLRATPLLWRAAWLLRRQGVALALQWADQVSPAIAGVRDFTPQQISDLVAAATRLALPAGSCLPQSLVTCRLLTLAGYRASLVIGAKSSTAVVPATVVGGFSAHAWVETAGGAVHAQPLEFNRGDHEVLVKFSKSA